MTVLIDTNVAIHVRDQNSSILDKLEALEEAVVMSIVTRVELEGGIAGPVSAIRRERLDALYSSIPSLPFDNEAAAIYGKIVAAAGYSRRKLLDRMIAAQALQHSATLVTLNPQDFADVPGLSLLAW